MPDAPASSSGSPDAISAVPTATPQKPGPMMQEKPCPLILCWIWQKKAG